MAILENIAILLVESEVTYATDPLPLAADAVQTLGPITINPAHTSSPRPGVNSAASDKEPVAGDSHWDITIEVENKGSGTAGTPPEFGPLLQASGYLETIVPVTSVAYTPDISQKNSATIYWFEDGLRYRATGCRFNASFNGAAGEFGKWTFTGKGLWVNDPDDVALVASPVYDTTKPPPIINTVFTVGGFAAVLRSFVFDSGVGVNGMKAVGPLRGINSIEQEKFVITGTMVAEHNLVATRAWEANLADGNINVLSWVIGSVAGNITTFDSPCLKKTSLSKAGNAGVREVSAEFKLSESAALKDDLTVTYT